MSMIGIKGYSWPLALSHPQSVDAAPRPVRAWGFWATLGWLFVAMVAGILCGLALFAVSKISEPWTVFGDKNVTYSAGTLTTVLVLLVARSLRNQDVRAYFALFRPRWSNVVHGLALLAVWLTFGERIFASEKDFQYLIETYRAAQAAGTLAVLWLDTILVAPVAEELIFRGLLYRGWTQTRLGVAWTILLTSVMFGLMHFHYSWLGMTSCFISGLFFGWARWRSGTVTLPIILHAALNVFSMRWIALSVS